MVSLIPAACAALLCAPPADLAGAVPGVALVSPAVLEFVSECLPPNSARPAAEGARRTGPLGWLLKHARDEDEAERPRLASPISYYLRSPLLTSFFGPVPCPNGEKRPDSAQPVSECATMSVRGREGEYLLELALPQLGAPDARRLRAVVSDYQARGEPLHVFTHGQIEVEVKPGSIRDVQSIACR
jgi:hypothetical protein